MPLESKRSAFFKGGRDTLPLIIGAVPFGIVFGTLSGGAGLSAAATMSLSAFVFAGSAQFIAVGLVAADRPPLVHGHPAALSQAPPPPLAGGFGLRTHR